MKKFIDYFIPDYDQTDNYTEADFHMTGRAWACVGILAATGLGLYMATVLFLEVLL